MSLDLLRSALEVASGLIQPVQPHYSSLFTEDGTPKPFFESWLTEPIAKAISETPQLEPLLNKPLNTTNSFGQISNWHLAQASIHHLLAKRPVDTIIADFVDLSAIHMGNSWTYLGIFGYGVSQRIEISEDVAIMPAAEAPPSLAREIIFGIDRGGKPILKIGEFRSPKPNLCALLSNKIVVLGDQSIDEKTRTLRMVAEKTSALLRALTLSSGCPFSLGWQISWIDHPAIPYEGIDGYGASGTFEETPKPRSEMPSPVDTELARNIFKSVYSLPSSIKEPVELAIDRLRRSRIHTPSVDTALDLGLAAEIAILHEAKGAELSYRFSLRGAHLLENDPTLRKETFKAFRAMYDARSAAAHTGRILPKHHARLAEFDRLCRSAILKLIERGNFPDWDDLILGL
ncbi:hypothetical protein ACQR1N_10355 [Bradyrhizobium sp. HKCCYLRH1073]|uniref:hypothetical protein n=1 Tax=unclassified Bradyrhizobium TaxID=2631580 RepID=UPI003EB990DC